ncbi:chorion peroxidase-like isoform X1 [Centruroides sculpturatus]|uniref:chorion peroxidase-like isoform X1 n=1 Tax=Centruroides sculpturatus TaxID=218467 RepID=UPI000C6E577C|nr:chorion peroxidase-like isoform X1 [Centruroides sculpturatus]XP_023222059.1 chorion peroxidase-like isoform X1 [Centruroides sculpturatus]
MGLDTLFKLFILNIFLIQANTEFDYVKRSKEKIRNYVRLNEKLEQTGNNIRLSNSERAHQMMNVYIPCGLNNCFSNTQYLLEAIASEKVSRLKIKKSDVDVLENLEWESQEVKEIQKQCLYDRSRPTDCHDSKFRNFDGSCNNLERPDDGRTFTCFRRLLRPDYADGVKEPRAGVENVLPDARIITRKLHRMRHLNTVTTSVNSLHMSYGQFLDHDLEFTSLFRLGNSTLLNCCRLDAPIHHQCFPLQIRSDDPDFSHRSCLNFVRNSACPTCNLGWREQMNVLPSAIDCSQVYGTSDEIALSLRNLSGNGELATQWIPGAGVLPLPNLQTKGSHPGFPPFRMGDFRVNQNLLLTTFHIMFLRFHNYVARHLRRLNPMWDGDRIYMETRRFVGACMQHITYEEYLPLLLGPMIMRKYHLDEDNTRYDSRLSLSLFNYFVSASFRFGHSTIPDTFLTLSEDLKVGQFLLKDTFFNPVPFYQGRLEDLIRGSTLQFQDSFDRFVANSVARHLFQSENDTVGLDLPTINIQRGRDHGLPGYKFYVEKTHNFRIDDFDHLHKYGLMSRRTAEELQVLYDNKIEDVDLFVGLLCEEHLKESLVGPTAAHLIAKQFFELKFGDRYFYTHRDETGSFTLAQKAAIREVFLSNIICATTEINEITIDAMVPQSPIVPCSHLKPINFLHWKE